MKRILSGLTLATLVAALAVLLPNRVYTQTSALLLGNNSGTTRPFSVTSTGALNVAIGSGSGTFSASGLAAGPATAPNAVVTCSNTTDATVSVTTQWSPGCPLYIANGWDTDDAINRITHGYFTLRPVTGSTVTSQLQLMMEVSPFTGGYLDAFVFTNGGQMTAAGSIVAGQGSSVSFSGRSIMRSTADGEMDFQSNAGTGGTNAAMRFKVLVEANTGTKTPTTIENNEYYTNTGDGDGSAVTLLNDPAVGTTYSVMATVAQTITVTASAGETLKYGATSCGTSLTTNVIGSSATFVAATGGSGAIWVTTATTGTWVCTP